MTEPAVSVDGVSKRFLRPESRPTTFKEVLANPFAHLRGDSFWALRDVNLTVGGGETLGVIGANGSGKSTLLRLIGGVGRPTRGRIVRTRPIDAMLSLGELFDPLLTGRENAVTAGILGGETRKQVQGRLDDIAAFAELEEFLDVPLKAYSDGMRLRLAFAVAATTAPDMLLIDEILSVGDIRFQAKCLDRLEELQRQGTTIVFATHDEEQVRRLCDRVVLLAHGTVQTVGPPEAVFETYREAMRVETERRSGPARASDGGEDSNRFGTRQIEAASVHVVPHRRRTGETRTEDPLRIEIELVPREPVDDPVIGVTLHRAADGAKVIDVSTDADGVTLGHVNAPLRVVLEFDRLDLEPGSYRFDVGVYERDWAYVYDYHWQLYELHVGQSTRGGYGPPRRWTVS